MQEGNLRANMEGDRRTRVKQEPEEEPPMLEEVKEEDRDDDAWLLQNFEEIRTPKLEVKEEVEDDERMEVETAEDGGEGTVDKAAEDVRNVQTQPAEAEPRSSRERQEPTLNNDLTPAMKGGVPPKKLELHHRLHQQKQQKMTPKSVHRHFVSLLRSHRGPSSPLFNFDGGRFNKLLSKTRFNCSSLSEDIRSMLGTTGQSNLLTRLVLAKLGRVLHLISRARIYLRDLGFKVLTWKEIRKIHFGQITDRGLFRRKIFFGHITKKLPRLLLTEVPIRDFHKHEDELVQLASNPRFESLRMFWTRISLPEFYKHDELLEIDLEEAANGTLGFLQSGSPDQTAQIHHAKRPARRLTDVAATLAKHPEDQLKRVFLTAEGFLLHEARGRIAEKTQEDPKLTATFSARNIPDDLPQKPQHWNTTSSAPISRAAGSATKRPEGEKKPISVVSLKSPSGRHTSSAGKSQRRPFIQQRMMLYHLFDTASSNSTTMTTTSNRSNSSNSSNTTITTTTSSRSNTRNTSSRNNSSKSNSKNNSSSNPKRKLITRRPARDPSAPRRPLSSYMLFCQEERPRVQAEFLDWKASKVAQELGRRWREADEGVKRRYQVEHQNSKLQYEEAMAAYSQRKEVGRAASEN